MPGHSLLTVKIVKFSQAINLVSLVSGRRGGGESIVSYTNCTMQDLNIHLFVPPMFT